jgi:hypothetical protein
MSKLTTNGQPPELHLKSRADLARALHMPGVVITVLAHWQPQLVGTTRTPKARSRSGSSRDPECPLVNARIPPWLWAFRCREFELKWGVPTR